MLTKSYTTKQYINTLPQRKVVHVTGSYIPNERLRDFLSAETALKAVSAVRLEDMSPQVIKCPAVFTEEVKAIFIEYKNLSINELLNKKFINCFDFEIYINPLNLKGGLILNIVGDGVNHFDKSGQVEYIKGSPALMFESLGAGGEEGIYIQDALCSTLTGTDYKAFPDLKEVLKKSRYLSHFYKLSMDGIKKETLEKFQNRRTKWLEKYISEFMVKQGKDCFHLLQARSSVGLPAPKCGMKVYNEFDKVAGVAFYID